MASKGGGSRASGTDGSDFGYRQRVDTKYQKAALTRKSLKKVLLGLFVYYPCMLAFALVPSIVNDLHRYAKVAAVLGFINLAAGLCVRIFTHEDKRMCAGGLYSAAWVAAELAASLMPAGTPPGRIYPAMVSLELLLEFVGAILPSGVVALAHALVMYTSPASAAKSK